MPLQFLAETKEALMNIEKRERFPSWRYSQDPSSTEAEEAREEKTVAAQKRVRLILFPYLHVSGNVIRGYTMAKMWKIVPE